MGKRKSESDLPYQVREESNDVVQLVDFSSISKPQVVGTRMKDDLIGVSLPPSVRMVTRFGSIATFERPEDMYHAAMEYFKWATDNPIEKEEMIKGGPMAGQTGTISVARPFSVVALRTWIGLSAKQWKKYKEDPIYAHFHDIVEFFEDVCKTQKLEHAMVGLYNANIVSKDLGMADKTEVSTKNETSVIIGMRIVAE